jgi:photosystem II stability/assembly factor-like uncharacterized protein
MKKVPALVVILLLAMTLAASQAQIRKPTPLSTATSSAARQASWEQRLALNAASPFRGMSWRAVGPKAPGGRIESIDAVPGDPSTIYLGVGSGNVWKTENGGLTWRPIFERESTFTIGALAVSRSRPGLIWVGTGESLMARSSFAGTGMFKSTDDGRTWKNVGLGETHHIGRVILDPGDPDVVYVAALGHQYTYNEERGLFKTTDGGATWTKSLFLSDKVGVGDAVMDPSDSKILYAAAWERDRKAWRTIGSGPGSGIYKTSDAGGQWKKLTAGLPTGPDLGKIGLAVSASNPNVVYAAVDNPAPDLKDPKKKIGWEIYRSEDKGETWAKANREPVPSAFGDIQVSPEDADRLYVLGVDVWDSADGGKTFSRMGGTVVHLLPHPTRALHLDQHDLWIDPRNPKRLLLGNDGGLYISQDRGLTWLHTNSLPISEFYAVSVDAGSPYRIFGGTQDNAALFGPGDRSLEDGIADGWSNVWIDLWGGGDSYYTLGDPLDPDVIYYEQQFGGIKRKSMSTGAARSIQPRAGKDEPPLRFNWMSPFLISRHNPLTVYFGANKLFKSLDRGDHWTCVSPDLSTSPGKERQGDVPYATITTVSESPLRPGLLYVGTDDGNVHITRNDGVTWTKIRTGLPDKWVSRVEASTHDEGTVYAALTGYREDDFATYIYKSVNYGATWVPITANLPAESVNVVREDPQVKGLLYVGTDQGGVYASRDAGASWESLCADLPTCAVHDIALASAAGELVIGTHGRSSFVLDIAPIRNYDKDVRAKEAHLFDIRPAVLPKSGDYAGDWAYETRRPAVVHYALKTTEAEVRVIVLDGKGAALRTLVGTGNAGINRVEWDLAPEAVPDAKGAYWTAPPLVRPGKFDFEIKSGNRLLLKGEIVVNKAR